MSGARSHHRSSQAQMTSINQFTVFLCFFVSGKPTERHEAGKSKLYTETTGGEDYCFKLKVCNYEKS